MTNGGTFVREAADWLNEAVLAEAEAAEIARVALLRQLVTSATSSAFAADGATSLTAWLRRRAEMTAVEASRTARRVNVLRRLPQLAELLWAGDVKIGHLDALAEVATERRMEAFDRCGEQLIEAAMSSSVDRFAAGCKHFAALADEHVSEPPAPSPAGKLSYSASLFGEAEISGRLTADQAAIVGAAFGQLCDPDPADAPVRRSLRERRADALAELADNFLGGGRSETSSTPRRAITPVTVVVGLSELVAGVSGPEGVTRVDGVDLAAVRRELIDSGPIPGRLVDHLTCDAAIRRLVVDAVGNPLDLGRSTKVVSWPQRHALAVRDGGCVFPTCDRPAAWCDAHHLRHWAKGGATDLDNLVLLCRHHHRLVHGPEWDLTRDQATGVVTATRSDGRRYRRCGSPAHDPPPGEPPDPPV